MKQNLLLMAIIREVLDLELQIGVILLQVGQDIMELILLLHVATVMILVTLQELRTLVIPACTATDGTSTVATHTFKVPRWRGFDNPFGDIWTNLDGVVIQRAAANEISSVYTTTDKAEFTDVIGNKTIAGYEVAQDGYIKEFDLGETAEIIPSSCTGSSATTYMCDYHYCNASSTALRTLLVGGRAHVGGDAGLGYFCSSDDVGSAYSTVGFRTLNRVS